MEVFMNETSRSPCIDLKATFGDRFRVELEESYYAEKPEFRSREEAWLTIIPCRHGHIYPFGGTKLAAWTENRIRRPMLQRLACVEVHQDCDQELTVLFDVSDFDLVAAILIPSKRRRLSPERKAALIAAGAPYRIQPKTEGVKDMVEDHRIDEVTPNGEILP